MRCTLVLMLGLSLLASVGCGNAPTEPTPRLTPAPPTVFRDGTLRIPQTWGADLDNGTLPIPFAASDVWFEAVTNEERYLTPTGAMLAVSGLSAPGYDGCVTAAVSSARIPVAALTTGLYLCARTNEARVVEIRVVEPPGPGGASATLVIGFTTFAK